MKSSKKKKNEPWTQRQGMKTCELNVSLNKLNLAKLEPKPEPRLNAFAGELKRELTEWRESGLFQQSKPQFRRVL